ncbi:efflux RND transporter permease subunit, partial [Aliarcobacter butzleri]
MVLSVIVALTLTPALCSTILKPHKKNEDKTQEKNSGFFFWFDTKFENFTNKYKFWVEKLLYSQKKWIIFYVVIIISSGYIFIKL